MDNLNGKRAAFSIGNIVDQGLDHNRKPGDWYGPSTMIQICEQLNEKYKPFPDLKVISFPEGVICIETIGKKANSTDSLLLLIGLRLGIKKVNAEYLPSIKRMIKLKYCVGINGGQGSAALYFVGIKDERLIFLDPHVTQEAVRNIEDLWVEHLSYHYPRPLLLPLEKINTSFAIGYPLCNL